MACCEQQIVFPQIHEFIGIDHNYVNPYFLSVLQGQYLSDEIERIQKRALKIINPDLSYRESLEATLLPSLSQRRHKLCQSYFGKMTNPSHKLHYLLPEKRNNNLRNNANFTQFQCFSNRFKNSFIPSSVQTFNSF